MVSRLLLAGPALALGLAASWTAPARAEDNAPLDPKYAFFQCMSLGGEVHQWTENGRIYTECCMSADMCIVCAHDQCVGFGPATLELQGQPTPPSRLGGGIHVTPGITLQPAH